MEPGKNINHPYLPSEDIEVNNTVLKRNTLTLVLKMTLFKLFPSEFPNAVCYISVIMMKMTNDWILKYV